MKLKLRKFFIKLWEKINFGNNKKKITIWFFVSSITIAIVTILLVSVFSPKHNIYNGQTVSSIK